VERGQLHSKGLVRVLLPKYRSTVTLSGAVTANSGFMIELLAAPDGAKIAALEFFWAHHQELRRATVANSVRICCRIVTVCSRDFDNVAMRRH
jgi:hypothetical protein